MSTRASDLVDLRGTRVTVRPAAETDLRIPSGGRFDLKVILASEGAVDVRWADERALNLAYRWLDDDGECIEADGERTHLPKPLEANSSSAVDLKGHAPASPGRHSLVVSLVLEGVHWACDVTESGWFSIPVTVSAPAAWPEQLEDSIGGKALRGAIASVALANMLSEEPLNLASVTASPNPTRPDKRVSRRTRPLAKPQRKVPLRRRLRAWVRHALGIPEMREAIEELLDRTAHQHHQLAKAVAELDGIRSILQAVAVAERDSAGQISQLMTAINQQAEADKRQGQAQLAAMASGSAKLDRILTKTAGIGTRLTAQRKMLEEVQAFASAIDEMRAEVTAVHNATRKQSSDLQKARGDVRSLRDRVGTAECNLLKTVSSSEAMAEALSLLRDARERQEDLAELQLIRPIHDAVARLRTAIREEAAKAREEFESGFRESDVVVEIVSTMRQIAEWAFASGNPALLGTISQALSDLAGHVEAEDARKLEYLDDLQRYAVTNSTKLDSVITRETIPIAGAGLVIVRNPYGFLAIHDHDVPAIAYYSSGKLPEAGTVAIVERLLEPGDIFVDVGANVGAYTLLSARLVGASGRVIAVEPMPSTVAMLRTTVAINGISNLVEIHECALGAANARVPIYSGATSGHSSLIPLFARRDAQRVEVELKPGEEIVAERTPKLIKIDVEGSELDVVKGLESVLERTEPALIVECSPAHIRANGVTPQAWLERIVTAGRQAWVISDDPPSLRPLRSADSVSDAGANLFVACALPECLSGLLP